MKPHIIITGGAQGIGKITTLELLKRDYYVTVFDKDIEALEELENEVDSKDCSLRHVDVANEQEAKCAIDESVGSVL